MPQGTACPVLHTGVYCRIACSLAEGMSPSPPIQSQRRLLCAGVVVVAVMVITTVLVSTVMLVVWQWHWLGVAAITGLLFIMESVLLSAVLYRV